MEYIGEHWRAGHILSYDRALFDFQYKRGDEYNIACAMDGDRLVGFLGAIESPWPVKKSLWLALWHTLPECRGTGLGGKLLEWMEARAGWIGTFGAGPLAVPVYMKRGYESARIRRWVPEGSHATFASVCRRTPEDWLDFRFSGHPTFTYESAHGVIFRKDGAWTHIVHVGQSEARVESICDWRSCDCWAVSPPGDGWALCNPEVPSVFHPPEARGNIIMAVGKPFVPTWIMKGDCDQDRPA